MIVLPSRRFKVPPIAQRNLDLRAKLWPDISDADLWLRKQRDGYTTIPRNMTLFMAIMDQMSKGKPVSMTYLELWCRAFDEGFITLRRELAFHAGFTGQRAERTWKERIRILAALRFIDIKSGASGPESYALIFNPYKVLEGHRANKTAGLTDGKYNAMLARAAEIGAKDLDPQALADPV